MNKKVCFFLFLIFFSFKIFGEGTFAAEIPFGEYKAVIQNNDRYKYSVLIMKGNEEICKTDTGIDFSPVFYYADDRYFILQIKGENHYLRGFLIYDAQENRFSRHWTQETWITQFLVKDGKLFYACHIVETPNSSYYIYDLSAQKLIFFYEAVIDGRRNFFEGDIRTVFRDSGTYLYFENTKIGGYKTFLVDGTKLVPSALPKDKPFSETDRYDNPKLEF